MLSPNYLKEIPKSITKLFEELEDTILTDISRRIAKAGQVTDTAQWQIDRLKAIGLTEETI